MDPSADGYIETKSVDGSSRQRKSGRMLGGVGGRHVSTRRRGSSPLVRGGVGLNPHGGLLGDGSLTLPDGAPRYTRRRRAVTTSDHKSCALIQTRLKLGDIM
ncbi:hypothetical protein PV328_005369 [Microctonus aethiopoides]|uniref:Uncharacterized protein n=1 Tax=Microctonus aethiopoides TaxID=144406 RepID=A0AA39KSE0_9HYME|nr:hypothetical protein PV328_005369 [Microctonus aethiopoides]